MQHVSVDVSALQLRTQVVGTSLRLGDRGGRSCLTYDFAVLPDFEPGEQELLVDLGPALVIPRLRRGAHRIHDGADEPHEWPPILLTVLRSGHGVEKPF